MVVRRARIVCTIGPAVDSEEAIAGLVQAGMDVARLNFSHGEPRDHLHRAELIRAVSARAGRPVAILQDLCGPKVRTGTTGPAQVEAGQTVRIVSGRDGDAGALAVDYPTLGEDLEVGDAILLGDGKIELRVRSIEGQGLTCLVQHGGRLRARMGVNLPSDRVRFETLTDKDRTDLDFGLEMGVDYVALSFVRSAADVNALRALCEQKGCPTPIVAKIETPSAVGNLESIVQAADAVMVARGDLGVELPPEDVPVVQKQILGVCRLYQRPVIVATEMLASMVDSPRPTRAETSDVAGAVFDGADAVMLSAETATGQYPVAACDMMDRIIREAEGSRFYAPAASAPGPSTPEAIAQAACGVASEVGAKLIVALTQSGGTARLVSKARPTAPVVAFSPDERTLRRLCLYWGVEPRPMPSGADIDGLVEATRSYLVERALLAGGDRFVVVYGAPLGQCGSTNALRVEVVP